MSARVTDADAKRLQGSIQKFVRSFGLLVTRQTPCGQPLSPSYAHALMFLLDREEQQLATSQSELAAELGLDKSSIARLCACLQKEKHATQARPEADGRSRVLTLTPTGRRMAAKIRSKSLQRFRNVASAVPAAKRAQLLDALQTLTAAVETLKIAEP